MDEPRFLASIDQHMARSNEHMARSNEHMASIDQHMARGNEHMARGNEHMARGNELMEQNRKAFERSGQAFDDLGNVLREVNLRNERVLGELSEQIRRNGDIFKAEMERVRKARLADREAFFRGLGRLLGEDEPPPAAAA